MTNVTAKAQLNVKTESWGGNVDLSFMADYADGANAAWAAATPALSLQMTVQPEVARLFDLGGKWTLTLTPTVDETPASEAEDAAPAAATGTDVATA